VTVLRKILKDADAWLMSARWWTELQRKLDLVDLPLEYE
jgi:hypothetical protein